MTTALPLFVALDRGWFDEVGLSVEPVEFATSNLIVEALVANRVQATSVVADFPVFSMAVRAPDRFDLYAFEVLDTLIAFDMILARPDSDVRQLSDLAGRRLATFPGSQLKHYATLILSTSVDTADVTIVEMAPPTQISALSSGSVDALFCLEPICTAAIEAGVGIPISESPISRYLADGEPITAASFAISTQWLRDDPDAAEAFVNVMWRAIEAINENQAAWRHLYPRFTPIDSVTAPGIPVTWFATSADLDRQVLEREVQILQDADLLPADFDVGRLLYKPRAP